MNRLLIVGAGGHGVVVADAAELMQQWDSIDFLDDEYQERTNLEKWTIVGPIDLASTLTRKYDAAIVAIGDNTRRRKILQTMEEMGFQIATVRHPSAIFSSLAESGAGTVCLAGSVVNARAKLGAGCIINTVASVDHDCTLGDAVHIAPGAHLAASVSVGSGTFIGIGASIRDQVQIGRDAMIGAGAAVVTNVGDHDSFVGVPARRSG